MHGAGNHGVDWTRGAFYLKRLDNEWLATEQPGSGVEEMDTVLDEDPAADPAVPEPVARRQLLVAGQVLERKALQRPDERATVGASQVLEPTN